MDSRFLLLPVQVKSAKNRVLVSQSHALVAGQAGRLEVLAGEALGPGLVLDLSVHFRSIVPLHSMGD